MKKILLFLFIAHSNVYAQQIINKIYYANSNLFAGASRANTVIQTSDGGYLLSGTSNNLAVSFTIKTNSIGDTLWSIKLDLGAGNYSDYINTAIETNDGNYIIGGTSGDPVLHQSHADLIKLNKNTGDTIWTRKIGLPNLSERCLSIKQTADGGFAFCGWRYMNTAATTADFYLVKTDSLGIPQWERTYGGAAYDFAYSLEITAEGGYMILGTTYSYGVGQYNMYLIKTDSIGNMLWQKTYGGNLGDNGNSIVKTNDGNYVLAGSTHLTADTLAAYIVKIDTAGTVIWQKQYKGLAEETEFNGVKQLPTGEIMICGDDQGDVLNYSYYGILKKINETDGSLIWSKNYKYFNTDTTQHYFYAMDVCNDGGFVIAGMTLDIHHTVTAPRNAMWLVKTDCMGNDSIWDSVACNLWLGVKEETKEEISVYPNPATNSLTLALSKGEGMQSVKIYNVMGELVLDYARTDKKEITLDVSKLQRGLYVVEVQTEKGTIRKKFVKE